MTRFLKHGSFPYVSSTLIANVLSLAATVFVVPVIASRQLSIEQSSALPQGSRLYRLSPIPAGAPLLASRALRSGPFSGC